MAAPGLRVYRSNRGEVLAERLADVLAEAPADPFARECIVVQGRGMERWLALQLADRLGVWAAPDFVFPRALIERAVSGVLGEGEAVGAVFEPECLMWSIAEILPDLLERPAFGSLRGYLARDVAGDKAIQLAQRIAASFDHYVTYRPQMLLEWERGGQAERWYAPDADVEWQRELWRELVARHGSLHLASRATAFLDALAAGVAPPAAFPRRVSIFGISTLPPLYLSLLAALAGQVEIHFFVLSPSREYWADIRSEREQLRRMLAAATPADEIEASLPRAEGHALLASLGRVAGDFQPVLEAAVDYHEDDRDLYVDPVEQAARTGGTDCLLVRLQSDMLALCRRGPGEPAAPPLPLRMGDDSIRVHSCHGPMREVEVLHDQLLDLFERDSSLEPRDVIVMTPDIERYAPSFEAVFGAAGARIPFRIADRGPGATFEVVHAFERALDLLGSRFTASQGLDLLGLDCVRARFGIEAGELDRVRDWVDEVGVRWGVDAVHRAELGQPATTENSWRFGLERLLLGHALSPGPNGSRMFAGRLPFDDVEGQAADLAGRLADYCETLFTLRAELSGPRPVADWCAGLRRVLERLVESSDALSHQHQIVRRVLRELEESAGRAGFDGAVPLAALRSQLERSFQRGTSASGFLSGGVTLCEMLPMRSIPFRVVCLMGLDDGSFPRIRRPLSFDLISTRRLPGDRSSRDDDRMLFLEALLSARDHLLISYVGQGIRDNVELPPSVVVVELLDLIGESFRPALADVESLASRDRVREAIRERLVVRHPLQPFSPRYFGAEGDRRLFSYSESHCAGAQAAVSARRDPQPFFAEPLPLPAEAGRELAIEDLLRFFRNPTRDFLQARLGLYLPADEERADDREPLSLDGLPRWRLGEGLLARTLAGEDARDLFDWARASGLLPLGTPGRIAFESLVHEVEALAAETVELRRGSPLPAIEIDAEIAGTRLTGRIADLWWQGQVRSQFGRLGQASEIEFWIRHLLLNWAAPHIHPRESHLVGRVAEQKRPEIHLRFGRVEDADDHLAELVRIYWLGQIQPLPFFPKTSRKYVESVRGSRNLREGKAMEDAYFMFRGDGNRLGERDRDPYTRLVFGDQDPLSPSYRIIADGERDEGFRELAFAVMAPLLDHREECA